MRTNLSRDAPVSWQVGGRDWLAVAVGMYRQPPNDPYDLAVALANLAHDETARNRLAQVTVHSGILQYALPWERQVAVQRRIDGYLLEQFGRVDPRSEDPERPMSRAEQWLHTVVDGSQFLNLAETLIEYDIDYDDIADDDQYEFIRRLLPEQSGSKSPATAPSLMTGPVYQTGLGNDDGVPRWPELDTVYLPAKGEPRLAHLEANGPCSLRERQSLTGGPLAHLQLGAQTRMLLREQAPGDTDAPVNSVATELVSWYAVAASADPVRGHAVIVGVRGDGTEADAPGDVARQLADLGHPVVSDDERPWPGLGRPVPSIARRGRQAAVPSCLRRRCAR